MVENVQGDLHIGSLLNSPRKTTNSPLVPSWNTPVQSPYSRPSGSAASTKSLCDITALTPGGCNDSHTTSITLQNCIATMDVGCPLNLVVINARTRNSEYNPGRFNGVIMRIRNPRATALIFKSGKVVCTGARNEHDALLSSKKFAKILQKLGFNVTVSCFRVQNFVATCDLRFPIKLENLHQIHGQFSRYEPEVFPGLIYRLIKPRLVLLIFVNGKIVFTGAKTRQDIKEALETMYPILKSFRKN